MTETAGGSVLVLAPTGRDAAVACELLEKASLSAARCASVADLVGRLEEGAGPAVIAQEALDEVGCERLRSTLDRQPSWSDPPLVIFAEGAAVRSGLRALTRRRNTTVLRRPVQTATFLTVVRAAVESRRRQYEVRDLLLELRSSNDRLQRRARQLQRLTLEVAEAEERERRRLAEVLHDDLQQVLAGAKFQLGAIAARAARGEEVGGAVRAVEGLLDEAVVMSRGLSRRLGPPALRGAGLMALLEWQARQFGELHGLRVEVTGPDDEELDDERVNRFVVRAVQELLFNVVKHSGCDLARVEVRCLGGRIQVEVRDSGRGFDAAELDGADAGTDGLGMFSIRERLDLLGGGMEISSAPGAGTLVRLELPYAGEAGGEAVAVERGDEAPSPGAAPGEGDDVGDETMIRVLLVDDHRLMRHGLRTLLENHGGIEVVGEADDGQQAVELADAVEPDVIVMDAAMPVMDGLEATLRIKARHPDVRVIGLSMFEEGEMAQRMFDAGADAFLNKAGPSEALVAAIRGAKHGE